MEKPKVKKKVIKYTAEDKEVAIQTYLACQNLEIAAKATGISKKTINRWIRQDDKFVENKEVRDKNLADFTDKCSSIIDDALKLIAKVIDDGLNGDRIIPLRDLSNCLGVVYDKRALHVGESTANQSIKVEISDELKDFAD